MCIEVLKNPVQSILAAKKKNSRRTLAVLLEASILFALATAVLAWRSTGIMTVIAGSAASTFALVLVISLFLGLIVKIIASTLGGTGKYYEGLTTVSYSLVPISLSMLIAALVSAVPGGIALAAISIAVGFAYGVSMLYRAVKELFKTDMVTAFVVVSVLIIVIFIAASVSFSLVAISRLGTLLPVGA